MRELWDLSRCVLIWFYKFLTGKSGYKLISWHVSLLSDRSHISAERTFCRKEARNAVLTGFKGPKVMKLTWQIIDCKFQLKLEKEKQSNCSCEEGFSMIAAEISFQLITCCSGPAQEHTQKQGTVLWVLHSGQTALLQLSHITWLTLAQKVFFLQETITLDTGTVVAVKWWTNLWVYYKPQEMTCFII